MWPEPVVGLLGFGISRPITRFHATSLGFLCLCNVTRAHGQSLAQRTQAHGVVDSQ